MLDIKVPAIGESINEATLAKWLKKEGDYVERDEIICELESEKATFELNAEEAGVLKITVEEGETVQVGSSIGSIDTDGKPEEASATKDQPAVQEQPAEAGTKEKETASEKPQESHTPANKGIIEMKVPAVGESISEVTVAQWSRNDGDYVDVDEMICELESEKATFELNASEAGTLQQFAKEGDTLHIGDVIAKIDTSAARPADKSEPDRITVEQPEAVAQVPDRNGSSEETAAKSTPVAAAIMTDKKVDRGKIKGSGPHGKIFKQDVMAALERPGINLEKELFSREEKRQKMSNLRKTISRRLVEAKNATAMLTTFNEVDMGAVMEIRKQYKEKFKEAHSVGLGFMSFFSKACCFALQEWPAVNAYIDGDELVYHEYCDISIAVSTPKGLVVPVIRNAESLSMAGIEKKVIELATKARDNKLSIEEMTGGTFTITNGGVFGSLMSTPIINIPQSAILGMHKIQERPMAINGEVVVRPMMYLALSYDHRVIDGRESVSFLVRVKELLENPQQLLFGKDPVKSLLEL